MKLGLVGAGRIGKVHAENVQYRIPGAEVIGVADVIGDAAEAVAAQFNIPQATDNYHDLMSNDEIDAILVCSSTDTHAEVTIAAAEAGKHVFSEKPIDFSLERIDQVLAAVEKADVKYQVGFNQRFDSNHARVHAAIQNGEIGEPHLMHVTSRDPYPPPIEYVKVSGGLFLDMMIHDFDLSRFLMGCEAVEVYANAAVRVDPAIGEVGDVDTAIVMLKFENGVISTIDNSRQAVYGYDQRAEVFGSGGMISTQNNFANNAILSTKDNVRRDLPLNFFMDRYIESYAIEMMAFIKAVNEDTAVPVTGFDGKQAVVMGLAAKKSLDEGRPVKLSEIS